MFCEVNKSSTLRRSSGFSLEHRCQFYETFLQVGNKKKEISDISYWRKFQVVGHWGSNVNSLTYSTNGILRGPQQYRWNQRFTTLQLDIFLSQTIHFIITSVNTRWLLFTRDLVSVDWSREQTEHRNKWFHHPFSFYSGYRSIKSQKE
jgi:hypothetical protein